MGLIITQGKHDSSKDGKFDILLAKDVLAQIVGIKLADKQVDTLEITFKVLSGVYKGRLFWDRVNYNPTSDFSWRYRALRKAAGCPYSEKEGVKIDIEALLLNKAVLVDLTSRKSKDKSTGEDKEYQNITYKDRKKEQTPIDEPDTDSDTPTPEPPPFDADMQPPPDNPQITDEDDWGT